MHSPFDLRVQEGRSGRLEGPSLQLTAFQHLKIGLNDPKGKDIVFKKHPFSGAKNVSFGECKFLVGFCLLCFMGSFLGSPMVVN